MKSDWGGWFSLAAYKEMAADTTTPKYGARHCLYAGCRALLTVKLQIFVRYLFSYFRLETGSYVLIFVLSRVCEENDVEIQWLQSKKKFSYDIKFVFFQKYEMYENKYRTKICDFTVSGQGFDRFTAEPDVDVTRLSMFLKLRCSTHSLKRQYQK